MDFFLEKCAKNPGERRTTTTDAASREFLETLDDDIMTAIATTTPLSAKDSMKLADRLIEVSQETISRRERVFEERMEHMEKKNKMLEEKLVLMTTPQPKTTTTTTTNNRNNDKGAKADVASPTSEGTDTGTNNTIENEEDAIQKTLFRQHQETPTPSHNLTSHTPGIPSISLSPPRGQTMRSDASEFSPPFSNSRRYTNNNNNKNNNFYASRSSLRSATPISFRNKENILMRKLGATAASSSSVSTMKENDPQQKLLQAAERTMAQSVDDLQNLKAANDALRNELEKIKKQRDVDAESHRKALSESNALRASETAKLTEDLDILRGEKHLFEQRDEKARDDRDSAMKELSEMTAKFTANELDMKSKSSEISLLNATINEERGKLRELAEKCTDVERTKNDLESKLEVTKTEKIALSEEMVQLRDTNDSLRKELSDAQHASKKVFESRVVSEREISDLKASLEAMRQELEKETEKRHLAEENVKSIETVKEDIERAATIARNTYEKKVSKLQTKDGTFQEKLKLVNEKREKQNSEAKKALNEMTNQCRQAVEKAETLNDELISMGKKLDDSKAECRKLELDVARVPGLEFAADAANEEVKALRQKQLEDQSKFSELEQVEFQLREIIDRGRKETIKLVERGKKAEEQMHQFENMADETKFKLEQVELSEAMLKKENEERKSELDEMKIAFEKFQVEKARLESELERVSSAKLELENELASFANSEDSDKNNNAPIASPAGKAGSKAAMQKIAQKLSDAEADFKWLQDEHEKVHARLRASEEAQKSSRATVISKTKNLVMLKLRGSSLEGKLAKALVDIKRLEDTVAAKSAEISSMKLKSSTNSGGKSFFGSGKKSPVKESAKAMTTDEEKRVKGLNEFEEKLAVVKLEKERDIGRLEERHAEQTRALEAELVEMKRECVEAKIYADDIVDKANKEVQHALDREASAKRLAEEETKRARFERDSMAQMKLNSEVALENAAEKMRNLELELGRKPSEMPSVSATTKRRRNKVRTYFFLSIVVVPILFIYFVLVLLSYRLSSPLSASDAAFDVSPDTSLESPTCSRSRHFISMFEEALTNVAGIEYVNRCAMTSMLF